MATPFGADANDVDMEKLIRRLDKHSASLLSVHLNAPVEVEPTPFTRKPLATFSHPWSRFVATPQPFSASARSLPLCSSCSTARTELRLVCGDAHDQRGRHAPARVGTARRVALRAVTQREQHARGAAWNAGGERCSRADRRVRQTDHAGGRVTCAVRLPEPAGERWHRPVCDALAPWCVA
eukprot:6981723-Prymnesium_polylepis.1